MGRKFNLKIMYREDEPVSEIFKIKNFLNNQNYIINEKLKIDFLNDYYLRNNSTNISINIFSLIINKIWSFVFKNFLNKKIFYKNNFLFLNTLLTFLLLPFLFYFPIYIYIFCFFILNFWYVNKVWDLKESKVFILRINKRNENNFFKYSYKSNLIDYIYLSEKVLYNNFWFFLKSLVFTLIFTLIPIIIYYYA